MRSDLAFAEALYPSMVELSGRYRAEAALGDAEDVEKDLEYLQGLCIIHTQWQAYVDSQRKKETLLATTLPHTVDPIPVPEFTGDRALFPFFGQALKARIDLDDRFSGEEKLAHLHKACTGAARKAIDGLNYTDAGYTKAKKVLMEYFGSCRQRL